jgi:hypothetical protein
MPNIILIGLNGNWLTFAGEPFFVDTHRHPPTVIPDRDPESTSVGVN